MSTVIEQQVRYRRDIAVPLAEVPPGEDIAFSFISLWLERMKFLAKCAPDNEKSDLFIFREEDVDHRDDGLLVIKNSVLIPISSLHAGQFMVFQLKRKPESPIAEIKVSHI